MDALKLILMVSGGVLVAAASGSLWWLAPMLAYGALAVYEHTTTEDERPRWLRPGQGRQLLDAPRAVQRWIATGELPGGGRFLAPPPAPAADRAGGATVVPPGTSSAPGGAAPPPAAPGAAPAPPPAERPRWLRVVNDTPDQRPHMLIVGPTRSGKTTLATAAMGDRDGRAVVITPKLNPSNWRGAEIITLDDDGTYAPIRTALDAIETEKRHRIKVLRTQGADALEPLTIVFDEIGELAAFEPRAPEMMTQLSSIGAELKLRIIGIGTSDEALGVRRWKATRNNYVRIETDADRRATLDDGVRTLAVTTQDILPRAQVAQLRPWRGEVPAFAPATGTTEHLAPIAASAVPDAGADPLLAGLLASVPARVRAEVPAISPERAARLAAILESQPQPATPPTPPAQLSATVERGGEGGDIHLNVAVLNSPGGRGGREDRSAYTAALEALYEAAGEDGRTFKEVYATHRGTKEIVFAAWQRGRQRAANTADA